MYSIPIGYAPCNSRGMKFIPLELQGAYPRYDIHTSVFAVQLLILVKEILLLSVCSPGRKFNVLFFVGVPFWWANSESVMQVCLMGQVVLDSARI